MYGGHNITTSHRVESGVQENKVGTPTISPLLLFAYVDVYETIQALSQAHSHPSHPLHALQNDPSSEFYTRLSSVR